MTLQRRALYFFVLYAFAIVYLSLFPGDFLLHPSAAGLYWVAGDSRRLTFDTALNVLFYLPLGAAGFLAMGRGVPAWLASSAFGIALSLLIEWVQLWTPSRYGNLRDFAANGAGAVLGASTAFFIQAHAENLLARISVGPRKRLPAAAWLMLSVWALWHAFPFFPSLSLYRVQHSVAPWEWQAFGAHAVGFFILTVLMGRSRWLWLAFALVPAQVFLADRSFSAAETLGSLVGGCAAWMLGGQSLKVAQLALPVWLCLEEFRPFRLAPQRLTFAWMPFGSWFATNTTGFYSTIFSKLFLYTAVVWVLRKTGLGAAAAVAVPAVILLIGEWSQQWIEGRTPETTDLAVLAIGIVLLTLCAENATAALQGAEVSAERKQS
ncbi:MAG: VanZ family protein [Acidobacteriota bacterium]